METAGRPDNLSGVDLAETMTNAQAIANLVVLFLLFASFVAWSRLAYRWYQDRRPLVTPTPRPAPFWSPAAFLVLVGLTLVTLPMVQGTFQVLGWVETIEGVESEIETPESKRPDLPRGTETRTEPIAGSSERIAPDESPAENSSGVAVGPVGLLLSCLVLIGFFRVLQPKRFGELGLTPRFQDAVLGLTSALYVIPPLMVMMGVLSLLIPYEHEVLDEMSGSIQPSKFLVLFVLTAIVTPFVEEFSVRVLLQGSLQGIADGRPSRESVQHHLVVTTPNEDVNELQKEKPRAIWPVIVTSLIFAALHLGQGAAPIPLFFFSLALGYLYRQTGNITSPYVLHLILNSMTMIATYLRLA